MKCRYCSRDRACSNTDDSMSAKTKYDMAQSQVNRIAGALQNAADHFYKAQTAGRRHDTHKLYRRLHGGNYVADARIALDSVKREYEEAKVCLEVARKFCGPS